MVIESVVIVCMAIECVCGDKKTTAPVPLCGHYHQHKIRVLVVRPTMWTLPPTQNKVFLFYFQPLEEVEAIGQVEHGGGWFMIIHLALC